MLLLVLVHVFAAPAIVTAQDRTGHQPADVEPPSHGWRWQTDASVFFGFNIQERRFRDFRVWEAQNWMMAGGERTIDTTRVRLKSMLSLEPFTLRDIGSPQVFQSGETFEGGALIDYQHPHDLLMALGADVRVPLGEVALLLAADAVGSPSLGPPAFMHRPSAAFNPQAPLSHHHLDATHITPGVVRGGLEIKAWTIEGSWFRGRELDENRTDLDLGALDSYAARVGWSRNAWSAQASVGWLKEPELVTPYDAKKLTASLSFTGGGLAWMAAFGQKREIHGNLEAYLFEASWRVRGRDTLYTRVESVAKDILDVGFHPVGTFHRHRQSQVGAATLGYVRDFVQSDHGALGVGADITGYRVPTNLKESYGSPLSFHAFVRYRLRAPDASHVH
jgi:hypothetical protein